MSQNLSSAAVVIGALRVNHVFNLLYFDEFFSIFFVETWAKYKKHHMLFWYLSFAAVYTADGSKGSPISIG